MQLKLRTKITMKDAGAAAHFKIWNEDWTISDTCIHWRFKWANKVINQSPRLWRIVIVAIENGLEEETFIKANRGRPQWKISTELLFYCGKPGHLINSCHSRNNYLQRTQSLHKYLVLKKLNTLFVWIMFKIQVVHANEERQWKLDFLLLCIIYLRLISRIKKLIKS